MAANLIDPNLVDPLHGLSVLSLLSRTLKGFKGAANSEQNGLDSLLSNLKSLERKSSDVYLEEAKTVLSSCSESQGAELQREMGSEGMCGDVLEGVKDRPQERRPGMGRKRARFSLKPNTSQPSLDVDASLNIGQLQDPEDFFSAFEKLENAKRELKRQRGETLMDSTQHKPFMRSRSRRPGILGKTAGYKHRFSSVDSDEALRPPQGTFEMGISNPSNDNTSPETTDQHGVLPEKEQLGAVHEDVIQGSAAEVENRVDSLLDELLSGNSIDLDGDGAVSLLEEHLQIKPINLDKFCVPDFESLRKSDSEALRKQKQLPRPRTPLANIHNTVNRINPKILGDTQQERSAYSRASPSQPKSPFSSLSMLKRRIALSDPPGNPFMFHSIDMSPSHSSPLGIDKQTPSAHGDAADLNANDPTPASIDGNQLSFSGKSHPTLLEGKDAADSDGLSGKLVTEDLAHPLKPVDDNSNRPSVDTDLQQNGSGCGLEDEDEDLQPENVDSKILELGCQGFDAENLHSSESQLDNSEPSTFKDHPVGQQSDVVDSLPDPNNKDNQEPRVAASNEQKKQKGATSTRRKRKEVPSRKSLAGAGTMWESGVRRSTRIRMRPLEYWKGERFLYGRVHESLLTVIGCKYESPSTAGGKPRLKVKSFVSDEFKELVEQAALH